MPPLEDLLDGATAPSPAKALDQHGLIEHPPPPGVSVPNKTFLSSGASVQGSSASLVNNPVGNQKSSAKPNVGNQNSSTKRNVGNQKSSTKSIVRSQKSSINSKVGSQKSSQVIM